MCLGVALNWYMRTCVQAPSKTSHSVEAAYNNAMSPAIHMEVLLARWQLINTIQQPHSRHNCLLRSDRVLLSKLLCSPRHPHAR
jgi:hypothetical protein